MHSKTNINIELFSTGKNLDSTNNLEEKLNPKEQKKESYSVLATLLLKHQESLEAKTADLKRNYNKIMTLEEQFFPWLFKNDPKVNPKEPAMFFDLHFLLSAFPSFVFRRVGVYAAFLNKAIESKPEWILKDELKDLNDLIPTSYLERKIAKATITPCLIAFRKDIFSFIRNLSKKLTVELFKPFESSYHFFRLAKATALFLPLSYFLTFIALIKSVINLVKTAYHALAYLATSSLYHLALTRYRKNISLNWLTTASLGLFFLPATLMGALRLISKSIATVCAKRFKKNEDLDSNPFIMSRFSSFSSNNTTAAASPTKATPIAKETKTMQSLSLRTTPSSPLFQEETASSKPLLPSSSIQKDNRRATNLLIATQDFQSNVDPNAERDKALALISKTKATELSEKNKEGNCLEDLNLMLRSDNQAFFHAAPKAVNPNFNTQQADELVMHNDKNFEEKVQSIFEC